MGTGTRTESGTAPATEADPDTEADADTDAAASGVIRRAVVWSAGLAVALIAVILAGATVGPVGI